MIIGIAGKAMAGKDTAAKMLERIYSVPDLTYQEYHNREQKYYDGYKDIEIVHFADTLKEAAQVLFNLGFDEVNTQEGKKKEVEWLGKTVRQLLQDLGTCVRQGIDPDFWVKTLFEGTKDWKNIIIADVRYPNELEEIKRRGGLLIRIDRNGAGAGNHSSETALDDYQDWDFHIGNNGTFEDLFKVMKIFAKEHPIE